MTSAKNESLTPRTWIIGSGGLLGGALTRRFPESFKASPIAWSDTNQSIADLRKNLALFAQDLPKACVWQILWAAGHATVTSTQQECDRELDVFRTFVEDVNRTLKGPGRFFLASSAGGIFAGSNEAPFTSISNPCPISSYGFLKLEQEKVLFKEMDSQPEVQILIGRFSNLYGPGQDLSKLQGLVSRLILAALTKKTLNIFVPLDTLRDFIYVDDAAEVVADILTTPEPHVLAIIASGEPRSLGSVIAQVQDVIRLKIPITYGHHPSSLDQSSDLRMTPTFPGRNLTGFPVGVKSVAMDLNQRIQQIS
jgi:UDP-glucose 4-epimerase